jgi:hypothetical protein
VLMVVVAWRLQPLMFLGAMSGRCLRLVPGTAGRAAGDPGLASRTWVLLTEAPDGGWGLDGHANANEELVAAARAQIASLRAGQPSAI